MNNTLTLFFKGFFQVFLVAIINCYLVSTKNLVFVVSVSFLVSLIFAFYIVKLSFKAKNDRIIYTLGAVFASICGLISSIIFF